MTPAQHAECRRRSYQVPERSDFAASGRGVVRTGNLAALRYALDGLPDGDIPAGAVVRVLSYTNAGFRGIEAYVVVIGDHPRRIHTSAGNLDPVPP